MCAFHLLDAVVRPPTEGEPDELERFCDLSDEAALVAAFDLKPGDPVPSRRDMVGVLASTVAVIDALIGMQLDPILHHPSMQRLEASWRGLRSLVDECAVDRNASSDEAFRYDLVRIRVLDLRWSELARDLERAIDFDQSEFFRLVYTAEYDTPGGTPYGVLLADYEIRAKRSREHPENHLETLLLASQTAAAAFAPLIAGAHPELLGLESFRDLARPIDLKRIYDSAELRVWRDLRRQPDSRFVGLTLPRVLVREPYRDDPGRGDGFIYREKAAAQDGSGLVWGTAVYAFGAVLARSFAQTGWLGSIRGTRQGQLDGGIVTHLVADSFQTDLPRSVSKGSVEVRIGDELQLKLSDLGFIPLVHCPDSEYSAFYSTASIYDWSKGPQAAGGGASAAQRNDRLSAMLQYMFCVSRFAHYVKVIARDKIGSLTEPDEVERLLNDWLFDYAIGRDGADLSEKARYPLREANVQVKPVAGRAGVYKSIIHLRPHYQLDQLSTAVQITTELYAARAV